MHALFSCRPVTRRHALLRRAAGLALLSLLLWPARSAGADLHFIAVCETRDSGIGTLEDLAHTMSWANLIAGQTGLTLRLHMLSGADVTVQKTRSTLTKLVVAPDDVVYFYYTGHGYNPGDRKWPVLSYLVWSPADDVSVDEVIEVLRPKNPRLLVVLADCCNSYVDLPAQAAPPLIPADLTAAQRANFVRLFVDFHGTVFASSSSPGQVSLGGEGVGSLFTNVFMTNVLRLAGRTAPLAWEEVFQTVTADTAVAATAFEFEPGVPVAQVPQYVIASGKVGDQSAADLNLDADPQQVGDGLLTGTNDDTPPAANPANTLTLCGPIGYAPLAAVLAGCALLRSRPCRTRLRSTA